jgi:peptidoglycan hydrolase-like protein with peptidoglycan-binding domain
MPLSPFRARLALGAFLAIAGGIATNLLTLQAEGPPPGSARERSMGGHGGADPDRRPAQRREETPRERARGAPPVANERAAPPRQPKVAEPRPALPAHRVGSFAPSSGALARTAIPVGDPLESRRATVRAVQAELLRRGYEPGSNDGSPGLVTRAAVLAYEHDQGLPLTADPSPEVLAHLRHGTSAPGVAIGLDGEATQPAGQAENVIRSVQQSLRALGYLAASPDGQISDDTVRAIREFEMDTGLVPTGRISAPLVTRLARQLGSRAGG